MNGDQSCGAKTRRGTPCKKPAGWGTDHVGIGRCKLHGGATPIKHGLYSTVTEARRRELLELVQSRSDATDATTAIDALEANILNLYERLRMLERQPEPDGYAIEKLEDRIDGRLDRLGRLKQAEHRNRSSVPIEVISTMIDICLQWIVRWVPEAQREQCRRDLRDALMGAAAVGGAARKR